MAFSNRNLYIAASISLLTGALFGYSVGYIGGEIVLPAFLNHFDLIDVSPTELASARSWAVSTWIVGALIGVPLAMPVCSRFGRRLCLQFTAVLYVAGAIMQVVSSGNLVIFDVGRFINGLGVGAGTLVSPIYISEISPAELRGVLMSGFQVLVQGGALIGFWIAFIAQVSLSDTAALQWQIPVGVQVIAGGMLLLGALVIPESPRYLSEQGKHEATEKALSWLRRLALDDPQLVAERMEIEAAADLSEKLEKRSFFRELPKKDVQYRLMVGVGLMIAQNMVGMNAINYYGPVIFMSAGFTSVSASLFLTGIFGVVKVVASLAFMFKCVHVKGNRFWLMLGSTVCGVSMFVLAYCVRASPSPDDAHSTSVVALRTFGILAGSFSADEPQGSSITAVGVTSVLMVYIFSFFFGVSLGPISWNVCAEIFPLHINSTCCAITTCTQWLFQIVMAAMTPPLLASVGWGMYVIYGGFCVLSLLWVAVCVPETKGVGVGKPMDELFGVEKPGEDEEAILEVSETTALLVHDRRRRSSLAAYT